MEKEFQKNAKPMLMIKALLLAYAATGILLLILAFLLYKMGLGESQINIGNYGYIHCILPLWRILYGKKIKVRRVCMGYGVGTGYAVLLMALTFLTVHQISDFKEMLMMFFLCFFGGTLGGILA